MSCQFKRNVYWLHIYVTSSFVIERQQQHQKQRRNMSHIHSIFVWSMSLYSGQDNFVTLQDYSAKGNITRAGIAQFGSVQLKRQVQH